MILWKHLACRVSGSGVLIWRQSYLLRSSDMGRCWSFALRWIANSDRSLWRHVSWTAITTLRSTVQAPRFRTDRPCTQQYGPRLLRSGPNVASSPRSEIQMSLSMFTITGRQIFPRALRGVFVTMTSSMTLSIFFCHRASFWSNNPWTWWTLPPWRDWDSSAEGAVLLLCTPYRTPILNSSSKGPTSGPFWTTTKVDTFRKKWNRITTQRSLPVACHPTPTLWPRRMLWSLSARLETIGRLCVALSMRCSPMETLVVTSRRKMIPVSEYHCCARPYGAIRWLQPLRIPTLLRTPTTWTLSLGTSCSTQITTLCLLIGSRAMPPSPQQRQRLMAPGTWQRYQQKVWLPPFGIRNTRGRSGVTCPRTHQAAMAGTYGTSFRYRTINVPRLWN